MLVNLNGSYDKLLQHLQTGLYLVKDMMAQHIIFMEEKGWYEFDHEWPEFQGDVDSRLKSLRERFDKGIYFNDFGSCDSPEQFLSHHYGKVLQESEHRYCVFFTPMSKEDHPGYRWHKNGPYIGAKEQQCEHFGDEPEIDHIYQFHIYRKR